MRVVKTVRELQQLADAERAAGHRIGLVPTMGALHAGHLSLVGEARQRADRVWVTIFVNPEQFNEAADLEGYPRTFEEDLAACRQRGVDVVFAPQPAEMYASGSQSWVDVTELTKPGGPFAMASSASAPLAATVTLYPPFSRMRRTPVQMLGSSSTTSI